MDIKKYIFSHCVSPINVKIWDAKKMDYVLQSVPCGKCLHCRMTKMNEWVTRLYAEQAYSKYSYYITLDYSPFDMSNEIAKALAFETAAVEHNININHSLGVHPLLLCRNHFDDFHKRLRKNTGIKYKYFGCGEYGSKFGRPHFHIIIFSNEPFSESDFQDAWTIKGYKIGNVDFHDLVLNGTTCVNNKSNKFNSRYVFKYVCKYIMKSNFDFNKLATINFHKQYFNSTQTYYEETDTLFPESVQITDSKILESNWKIYCKKYSPFISCSRRPAIGTAYLEKNISRFTQADFRLFGLSSDCKVFPRYFLRKAKENSSSVRAISSDTDNIVSSSRIKYITTLLSQIQADLVSVENLSNGSKSIWSSSGDKLQKIVNGLVHFSVPLSSLSFYDVYYHMMFRFNGYNFSIWQKSKKFYFKVGEIDINTAISYLTSANKHYDDIFIEKMFKLRQKQLDDFEEMIDLEFHGDSSLFSNLVSSYYYQECANHKRIQIEINNSHILF